MRLNSHWSHRKVQVFIACWLASRIDATFCGIRDRSASMNSHFSHSFSRRVPDNITEELVAVLSGPKSYDFNTLFLVIQTALRAERDQLP